MTLLRKLSHIGFLIFLTLFLFACSQEETTEEKNNAASEAAAPVQFMILEQGGHNNFGNTRSETMKITDEKTWHYFWTKLHGNINPIPPLPHINFNDEMVIAILDAPRATSTLTFTLDNVVKDHKKLIANVVREEPGETCMMAQMISQPYVILKTAAYPEKVVLKVNSKIAECE